MLDAAFCVDDPETCNQGFHDRIHACVVEHTRLSGDQYDHR
jgi:hypothetical protein